MPKERQQVAQGLGGVGVVFDDEDSQWVSLRLVRLRPG
jgi:hypothetical protein